MIYHDFDKLSIYSIKEKAYLNTDFSFPLPHLTLFKDQSHLYYSEFYENTFVPLMNTLEMEQDEDYPNPIVSESFLFLRQSTITSFFMANMVDMPICFKKSKSLYAKTFEIPLLKFTNMVMRAGYRAQTVKQVSFSFANCFHKVMNTFHNPDFIKWQFLVNFLNSTRVSHNTTLESHTLKTELELYAKALITPEGLTFDDNFFLKNFLFDKLTKYSPLFSFSIRKVDKSIRKHSRGKSGKYTMIWKYVPLYKRLYVTTRWLLKELKFQRLKTFPERLIKILETFLLTPHLSFVCKLRKFAHVFVFYNFKQSLLKTLKSTS